MRGSLVWGLACGAFLAGAGCGGNDASTAEDLDAGLNDDGQSQAGSGGSGGSDGGKTDGSAAKGGSSGDAGNDASSKADADGAADTGAGPVELLGMVCNDTMATFFQTPANLPAYDSSRRGDVVRCAIDRVVSAADIQKAVDALGYKGPKMTSGALVIRIAYRTERLSNGGSAPLEGISSALVFLPDTPVTDGAQPLVMVGHGSIGIAESCAPTRTDVIKVDNHLDDAHSLMLPLAGRGWMVVATDYAGFGYGATPGWTLSEDEAHSLLDSSRAMKKLLVSGALSGKSVIIGHSQGGHAALSAHAYYKSYGMEGELVGVLAMAPFWINAGAWGGAPSPLLGHNTTDDKSTLAYSVDYFFGHGEIYDGAGHGTDMFDEDKRDTLRTIFTTYCLHEAEDHMVDLGSSASDFYDFGFVSDVSACVLSGICLGSDSQKWKGRFQADRPAIDAHGPPIVIWAGGKDESITPGRIKCAIDRMDHDLSEASNPTTTVRVCADPTAIHGAFIADGDDLSSAITRRAMEWTDKWIGARTLGMSEPDVCLDENSLVSGTLECETPPSNEDW